MSPDSSFAGTPVLLSAVIGRKWDIAELLLQSGANPNAQEKHNGYTVLMAALENSPQAKSFVSQLLARGADVRILNNKGEDARQMAEKLGVGDWLKNAPVVNSTVSGNSLTRERIIELVSNVRRGDSSQQAAALAEIRRWGDKAILPIFNLLDDPTRASDGLYTLSRLDAMPTHVQFALLRMIKDPNNTLPKRDMAELWMKSAKTGYSKAMMYEQLLDVNDFGNQTKIYAINGLRDLGPAAKSALSALHRLSSNNDLKDAVDVAINSIDRP
jgi:hypothetical protein